MQLRSAVVLFCLGGTALLAQSPSIAGWNPYSGPPGTVVTVSGNNLSTTTGVFFNGMAGTNLVIQSNSYVKVTVPAGATSGALKITNAFGSYQTGPFPVTTPAPPPPPPPSALAPSIASYDP